MRFDWITGSGFPAPYYGQDLDLWVYDKADRSNKVGWNVAGRSNSFAGGQIILDVDNWDGMEGPETTQFRNLASGTVEVWVNHYDDTFTQSLVASTPATVDIFCYRCLDDDNKVKVGFVRSVTQVSGDVPSGGRKGWKVGEFVAPGGSERVKWTTCVHNCYVDAATADLATSTGGIESFSWVKAHELSSTRARGNKAEIELAVGNHHADVLAV